MPPLLRLKQKVGRPSAAYYCLPKGMADSSVGWFRKGRRAENTHDLL